MTRRIEHRARQDQAIGRDHARIELERGERGLFLFALERDRRAHLQPQFLGQLVHGRGGQLLAAMRRARRLAVDRRDLVPGLH